MRLAEDRKVVGGTKTWAVVKRNGQTPAPPAAPEPRPEPAAQDVSTPPLPAAPDTRPQPQPAALAAELAQAHADNAALRQRVAALEDELRQTRQKIRLDEFFAQLRESGMRVVIQPESAAV
jgi:hypothetical protein